MTPTESSFDMSTIRDKHQEVFSEEDSVGDDELD
jgi:hypothetical protein